MNQGENKEQLRGHGFIAPVISDEDYFAGTLPEKVINPSGDWRTDLPVPEHQRQNNVEPNSCVTHVIENAIQTLQRFQYKEQHEYAERFIAIMSETDPNRGNNPKRVAQAIRDYGLLPYSALPYDETIDTLDKFYSPKPMTEELKFTAKKFSDDYNFQYEYSTTPATPKKEKKAILQKYLTMSPIGVSVTAWKERDGMYYKDEWDADNHFCLLVAYESYPVIFDTYKEDIKILEDNYDFGWSQRFLLEEKRMPLIPSNKHMWDWLGICWKCIRVRC